MDESACALSGIIYFGAGDCSEPLKCPTTDRCPVAPIVEVEPRPQGSYFPDEDPIIDARHPHPAGDNSLGARVGIGTEDNPIIITLGFFTLNAQELGCWDIYETGIEVTDGASLESNVIRQITDIGAGKFEIVLDRPISAGEWTVITYVPSCSSVCFGSLPADVEGNGTASAADILQLIDILNSVATPKWGEYSTDVDHSGATNAPDILEVIDLLNGAGTFIVWNNRALPPNPCAPGAPLCGGSSAMLAAGSIPGVPANPVDSNTLFADGFVRFVTTVTIGAAQDRSDVGLTIEALTKWCVRHFTAAERDALADRLSDPMLSFSDTRVRSFIPDVIEALRE